MNAGEHTKVFCCPICYEDYTYTQPHETNPTSDNDDKSGSSNLQTLQLANQPPNTSVPYVRFDKCSHALCSKCLYSHCEQSLNTRQIPIRCPSHAGAGLRHEKQGHDDPSGCPHVLSDADVQQILFTGSKEPKASNLWKRYLRFSRLAKDPTLITCPRCDDLFPPSAPAIRDNGRKGSSTMKDNEFPNAQTQCTTCSHVFCLYHGEAHDITKQTCSEYLRESHQIQESISVLESCTKPCSTCGGRLVKHAGCDHIVCPLCGNDMCWKCGSHQYLTGKVIRTCHKCHQGYVDHRHDRQHRLRMILMLPFTVPFVVLYVAAMSAIALGSCLFAACCCCTMGSTFLDEHRRHWNPRKAIHTGAAIVVLPVLLIMTDFGWHFDVIDEITESNQANMERNRSQGVAFPHHLPGAKLPEIPIARTMDEEEDEIDEEKDLAFDAVESTRKQDQNV